MTSRIVQFAPRRAALAAGLSLALAAGAFASPPVVAEGAGEQPALRLAPAPASAPRRDDGLAEKFIPEREDVKIVEQRGGKVPLDLVFRSERGDIVPLSDWFGARGGNRPVVVILMYFRCPLMCPQTISSLMGAVNDAGLKIGEDYNVVIVSFDPTEGPGDAQAQRLALLGQYTHPESEATDRGLAVLTDTANNARTLANALGFGYRYIPSTQQYSHMNVGFVLTQDGTISQYLKGVNYGGTTLKGALIDAGEGKVGSLIDRVAQWCMVYNETTGRYQIVATRVMKLGAGLCAVLTLGVVAFAVRADRVRRRRAMAMARSAGASSTLQPSTDSSGGALGRPSDAGFTS